MSLTRPLLIELVKVPLGVKSRAFTQQGVYQTHSVGRTHAVKLLVENAFSIEISSKKQYYIILLPNLRLGVTFPAW